VSFATFRHFPQQAFLVGNALGRMHRVEFTARVRRRAEITVPAGLSSLFGQAAQKLSDYLYWCARRDSSPRPID